MTDVAETAFDGFYATDWLWERDEVDSVKSLLPFFDRLCVAMDSDTFQHELEREPIVAQPLAVLGLLVNMPPSQTISRELAASIVETMGLVISNSPDSFKFPAKPPHDIPHIGAAFAIATLSWGPGAFVMALRDVLGTADVPLDSLQGLVSNNAWITYLLFAIRAQAICHNFRAPRRSITPVFPKGGGNPLGATAPGSARPVAGYIISSDIQRVGTDLSSVPLDEVLAFRSEHSASYRSYLKELLATATLIENNPEEYTRILRERQALIEDAASDLRKHARFENLKQSLTVGLGVGGAAWTGVHGEIVGALIGGAAALTGLITSPSSSSAYTYLFDIAALRH
jgi:hypothetical protein